MLSGFGYQNKKALSKEQFNLIEQRTLAISLYGVVLGTVANLLYGIYIAADIVILNGVFALLNLVGASISLLAAKLVVRPADKIFQYGYSHVEPLVHCVNALMMMLLCFYALINGVEGLRAGGHLVNSRHVIWFSIIGAVFSLVMWAYKVAVSRQIQSELLKNDTRKWIITLLFHLVALFGFAMLSILEEPYYTFWARYIDNMLVVIMAAVLFAIPLNILKRHLRAILHMVSMDEALIVRINHVMEEIGSCSGVVTYTSHIVEIGRVHFIDIYVLVDQHFTLQGITQQDGLRERVWAAIDKPADEVRFSLCITADKRWVIE